MNLLWLIAMAALLATNSIAHDDSDAHFLDLVRKKAQIETGLSEDEKMDDSSHEVGDDNLEEQDGSSTDTSKRTSKMVERNQPMQAPEVELRQSRGGDMKNGLSSRWRCKTLRCRLQYAFESDKDDNQLELSASKDKRGEDGPKKRCMAWQCKRHLLKTREKAFSKKSQGTNIKRCLAWGCKKRTLKAFKRDSTATQENDEMKEEDLEREERRGVKRQEEELRATDLKKIVPKKCLAWYCKEGKRTVPVKRSGEIDSSKRIVSRKPDDLLSLFGSSREGKCRGLECLTKRTRDATAIGKKNEMPSGCITWDCFGKRAAAKKEPGEKIDDFKNFKRIISRKNDNDILGLADEKCRGWECIMKHVLHNDAPIKCLSWDCDKRQADTEESTQTQDDINAESHEKDASQYGIPDEYKDMKQRPIRRDALRRISLYSIDKGSRPTSQKQDI